MQKSRIFLAIILAAVVLAVGAVMLFIPFRSEGPEVELTIEPRQPVRAVAKILVDNDVVPSATAFIIWLKLTGIEKQVQAGRHVFRKHEGILSAARKLTSAQALHIEVTIPEGLIIEQCAARCAEALGIDSAAFVKLCYDSSYAARRGYSARSLEGYLFPNTYHFPPEPSVEDVIERLVAQFEYEYSRLKRTEIKEKFSKTEIVTLASIIEKEATLVSERAHIAGVFHNRLRLGVPLGADPTVRYILRKFSGPLRVSELNNPSPYNTRLHRGLPPGPICSPGRGALEAAVEPLKTKDLYFVAKWDGSGAHDFSATHREHDRKKHEIRRQNELRKRRALKNKK
jgi:UPF0755 protein